jgi:hypothetical protein
VEIRIVLDRVEPPAGWLQVISGRPQPADHRDPGVAFVGWLGLLRALSATIDVSGTAGWAES